VGVVGASKKATFVVAAALSNEQLCIATNEPATAFVDVSGLN